MMAFIGFPPVRRRVSGDVDIDTQCLGPFGRQEIGGAADPRDPDQAAPRVEHRPAGAPGGGHAGILKTTYRQASAGPAEGRDLVAPPPGTEGEGVGEEPGGEATAPLLRRRLLPHPRDPPPPPRRFP